MLKVDITYKVESEVWKHIVLKASDILGYKSDSISIGTLSDFNTFDEFSATLRNTLLRGLGLGNTTSLVVGKVEFI